jgi:3'-5' exoribonuclease
LLAHTVKVTRIALSLGDITVAPYDRDLLIAAGVLHDIGKLDEYTATPGEERTDDGRLLGHIVQGVLRVQTAAALVPDLGADQLTDLLHAIVASHGKREFGSPTIPATIEALLLHLADQSEATIDAGLSALDAAPPDAAWTEFVKSLDGKLRRPRQ